MPPHARRVDHDAHARGEVGVHLRLHALDQVVVAEGLDVSERVDTVGGQVCCAACDGLIHALQRPHLVAVHM